VEHKDNFRNFGHVHRRLRGKRVATDCSRGLLVPIQVPTFSEIRDVPRNDETSHHFFKAHDEEERVLDVRKLIAGNFLMEEQGMTIDNTLKNKSTLRFLPFYRLRHFSS
jgi:hypothetical protein